MLLCRHGISWRALRVAARWLATVILVAVAPRECAAQVDARALRDLREGLERAKHFSLAVSATVTEEIRIVGASPFRPSRPPEDPGLRGKPVDYIWGSVPSKRTYEWLWSGDRWRIRETVPLDEARSMFTDRRCDGELMTTLTHQVGPHHLAQGSIERPRGTIATPAVFAYQPDCVWAADMLADMKLDKLRAISGPDGTRRIECTGRYRNHYTRLVFDPSRGYALVEHEGDGDRAALAERVTAWTEVRGVHVPMKMEERVHSGPSQSSPIWRIMTLTLSDVHVGPANLSDFRQAWPEGAQIDNQLDGKLYRFSNGRMHFLMHLGGRTPARMLMGWSVIGAVLVGGLAVVYTMIRRRRRSTPTH